jgi:hypothetical protein
MPAYPTLAWVHEHDENIISIRHRKLTFQTKGAEGYDGVGT